MCMTSKSVHGQESTSYPPFNRECTDLEVNQYVDSIKKQKRIEFNSLALQACGSEAVSSLGQTHLKSADK